MHFKDTIYFKKSLSRDLIDPSNGEIVIPRYRKLTKRLIDKASGLGLTIPPEILHRPRKKGQRQIKPMDMTEKHYGVKMECEPKDAEDYLGPNRAEVHKLRTDHKFSFAEIGRMRGISAERAKQLFDMAEEMYQKHGNRHNDPFYFFSKKNASLLCKRLGISGKENIIKAIKSGSIRPGAYGCERLSLPLYRKMCITLGLPDPNPQKPRNERYSRTPAFFLESDINALAIKHGLNPADCAEVLDEFRRNIIHLKLRQQT